MIPLHDYQLDVSGPGSTDLAARLRRGIEDSADLCQITPSVCTENLGIPRIEMPQLDQDTAARFVAHLRQQGVQVYGDPNLPSPYSIPVGELRATQREIHAGKVLGMLESYRNGTFPNISNNVLVVKDPSIGHYILDGHHRWATLLVDDPSNELQAVVIEAPIQRVLQAARSFPGVGRAGLTRNPRRRNQTFGTGGLGQGGFFGSGTVAAMRGSRDWGDSYPGSGAGEEGYRLQRDCDNLNAMRVRLGLDPIDCDAYVARGGRRRNSAKPPMTSSQIVALLIETAAAEDESLAAAFRKYRSQLRDIVLELQAGAAGVDPKAWAGVELIQEAGGQRDNSIAFRPAIQAGLARESGRRPTTGRPGVELTEMGVAALERGQPGARGRAARSGLRAGLKGSKPRARTWEPKLIQGGPSEAPAAPAAPTGEPTASLISSISQMTDPRTRDVMTASGDLGHKAIPITGIRSRGAEGGYLLTAPVELASVQDAQDMLNWLRVKRGEAEALGYVNPRTYDKVSILITFADGTSWDARFDISGSMPKITDLFSGDQAGGGITWDNSTRKGVVYSRNAVLGTPGLWLQQAEQDLANSPQAPEAIRLWDQLRALGFEELGVVYVLPQTPLPDDTVRRKAYVRLSWPTPMGVPYLHRLVTGTKAQERVYTGGLTQGERLVGPYLLREPDGYGGTRTAQDFPAPTVTLGSLTDDRSKALRALKALMSRLLWRGVTVKGGAGTSYGWADISVPESQTTEAPVRVASVFKVMGLGTRGRASSEGWSTSVKWRDVEILPEWQTYMEQYIAGGARAADSWRPSYWSTANIKEHTPKLLQAQPAAPAPAPAPTPAPASTDWDAQAPTVAVHDDPALGRFDRPVEVEWDGSSHAVDLSEHMPRNLQGAVKYAIVAGLPPHGPGHGLWNGAMVSGIEAANMLGRSSSDLRTFRVEPGKEEGWEVRLEATKPLGTHAVERPPAYWAEDRTVFDALAVGDHVLVGEVSSAWEAYGGDPEQEPKRWREYKVVPDSPDRPRTPDTSWETTVELAPVGKGQNAYLTSRAGSPPKVQQPWVHLEVKRSKATNSPTSGYWVRLKHAEKPAPDPWARGRQERAKREGYIEAIRAGKELPPQDVLDFLQRELPKLDDSLTPAVTQETARLWADYVEAEDRSNAEDDALRALERALGLEKYSGDLDVFRTLGGVDSPIWPSGRGGFSREGQAYIDALNSKWELRMRAARHPKPAPQRPPEIRQAWDTYNRLKEEAGISGPVMVDENPGILRWAWQARALEHQHKGEEAKAARLFQAVEIADRLQGYLDDGQLDAAGADRAYAAWQDAHLAAPPKDPVQAFDQVVAQLLAPPATPASTAAAADSWRPAPDADTFTMTLQGGDSVTAERLREVTVAPSGWRKRPVTLRINDTVRADHADRKRYVVARIYRFPSTREVVSPYSKEVIVREGEPITVIESWALSGGKKGSLFRWRPQLAGFTGELYGPMRFPDGPIWYGAESSARARWEKYASEIEYPDLLAPFQWQRDRPDQADPPLPPPDTADADEADIRIEHTVQEGTTIDWVDGKDNPQFQAIKAIVRKSGFKWVGPRGEKRWLRTNSRGLLETRAPVAYMIKQFHDLGLTVWYDLEVSEDVEAAVARKQEILEDRADRLSAASARKFKEAGQRAAAALEQADQAVRKMEIPGYFPTPTPLADKLVENLRLEPGAKVLDPSAGEGSLLRAVGRRYPSATRHAAEIAAPLREILQRREGVPVVANDIFSYDPGTYYDAVVINPPFEKAAWMDHLKAAFELLKPGGQLAAIVPPGFQFREDAKHRAFREWFWDNGGEMAEKLPQAKFGRTKVSTVLLVMQKDPYAEERVGPHAARADNAQRAMAQQARQEAQKPGGHLQQVKDILQRFEGGQPILVGHHSEKRARRDRDRADRAMRKAVDTGKYAEHLGYRAESAARRSRQVSGADVTKKGRGRRSSGLRASQTKTASLQAAITAFGRLKGVTGAPKAARGYYGKDSVSYFLQGFLTPAGKMNGQIEITVNPTTIYAGKRSYHYDHKLRAETQRPEGAEGDALLLAIADTVLSALAALGWTSTKADKAAKNLAALRRKVARTAPVWELRQQGSAVKLHGEVAVGSQVLKVTMNSQWVPDLEDPEETDWLELLTINKVEGGPATPAQKRKVAGMVKAEMVKRFGQ